MPFTVINGRFAPALGHPDGDSVRFIPDNPDPLFKLARQGMGPKINPDNGSIQLRYEAIDAMEKSAAPPWQMRARERNLAILGTSLGGTPASGHILSRQLDSHGRPICFAFAGANKATSGSTVHLGVDGVVASVNHRLAEEGLVYPLFYDTLFQDLRKPFTDVILAARAAGSALWPHDASRNAEWLGSPATMAPIFPKLWRRIDKYAANPEYFDPVRPFSGLKRYIAVEEPERVFIVSEGRFTGFDNVIETTDTRVSLLVDPLDLVVQP